MVRRKDLNHMVVGSAPSLGVVIPNEVCVECLNYRPSAGPFGVGCFREFNNRISVCLLTTNMVPVASRNTSTIWTCSAGAAAVVFIKNPFSICFSQESNPGHIDGNGGVVLM